MPERVKLWRRRAPSPYATIEVPSNGSPQLGDAYSHLPEVVVHGDIIHVRRKSGSYEEALVHRAPRVTFGLPTRWERFVARLRLAFGL